MIKLPYDKGLGELLEACASQYEDAPFLVEAESGRELTYAQFNALTNRFARGLLALGVKPGDFVGIMLNNCHEYMIASYALKKVAAVEVSVNSNFRGPSLARMLNLTELEILITEQAFAQALADVRAELEHLKQLIAVDVFEPLQGTQARHFDGLYHDDDSDLAVAADPCDTAVILFTSGTTGVSKGCTIPHRSSIRAAETMIEAFELTSADAVYSPYPLFHVAAAQYDVLPAMMVGGRAILRKGFSLSNYWQDLKRYRATWSMLLGSVMQLLWSAPEVAEEREHSLRFLWGTPLPIDHDAFERRFGLRLARGGGYGSTDAGSVAYPMWDKTGAGRVTPDYEVQIWDEQGQALPPGQAGELMIRQRERGLMASSYFGQPNVTAEAWSGQWFHSGDLCKLDQAGDLFWLARMSERIRVKGEMVSAYEIEEVVLSHESVSDCAVVGLPDGIGEETVHAAVKLRAGHDFSLEELRDYAQGKLSRFMMPTSLSLHQAFPMTPSGKISKAELLKQLG